MQTSLVVGRRSRPAKTIALDLNKRVVAGVKTALIQTSDNRQRRTRTAKASKLRRGKNQTMASMKTRSSHLRKGKPLRRKLSSQELSTRRKRTSPRNSRKKRRRTLLLRQGRYERAPG